MSSSMRRYAAEFIGTFVLVFTGCGAAVLSGSKIGYIGVALAFGLALLVMVYAIGPISGCHINPAVTLGLLMTGKFESKHTLGYVIGQLLGGIVGAGLVLVIAQGMAGGYDAAATGFASNGYGEHSPGHFSLMSGLITEIILTGLLVLTVLGSTDVKAPVGFAGVAIGLVLVMIHLVGIPVTNMSANPARSIATAVFARGWALSQLWLFIVAPLAGGVLAALVYEVIRAPIEPIAERRAVQATPLQQADRLEAERHAMMDRVEAAPPASKEV